jgi:tRNA(fMet)-specific endonuclease VapC
MRSMSATEASRVFSDLLDAVEHDGDADVAIAALNPVELNVWVELASARHREARTAFVADAGRTLPTLPCDERVADVHATLLSSVRHAGRPRGAHGLIIAATAAAWDRTIVTYDGSAFTDLPGVHVHEVRADG